MCGGASLRTLRPGSKGPTRRQRARPWPAATLLIALASQAVALEPVTDIEPNPGDLDLFVHAPGAIGAGAALVVALHGCTQTASSIDTETGLIGLADAVPFVLVLPEQREANNEARCFNFFEPDDNRPGLGESASIMAMIEAVEQRYATDPARVYILGLSAGGGMTSVMLANHPERFAGGAVIAGVPYACNRPNWLTIVPWWLLRQLVGEAAAASYVCGIFGFRPIDRSAADWAEAVRAVGGSDPDVWPLVSIWHGTADTTVDPANRTELVEQWTAVQAIDAVADAQTTVAGADRQVFEDAAGTSRVESWLLPAFPHAWPIDADAQREPCGSLAPNVEDGNVCAVREIARFWGLLE